MNREAVGWFDRQMRFHFFLKVLAPNGEAVQPETWAKVALQSSLTGDQVKHAAAVLEMALRQHMLKAPVLPCFLEFQTDDGNPDLALYIVPP